MIVIPDGNFIMGSPENEPDRQANEGPRHEVTISRPFYIGAHEVTVGHFAAFVGAAGYRTEAETSAKGSYVDVPNSPEPDPSSTALC